MSLKLLTVIASIFLFTNLTATELSNQELLNLIKEQQTQIEKLQKMVLANQKKVAQADDKIETTVEVVEMNLSQNKQQKHIWVVMENFITTRLKITNKSIFTVLYYFLAMTLPTIYACFLNLKSSTRWQETVNRVK